MEYRLQNETETTPCNQRIQHIHYEQDWVVITDRSNVNGQPVSILRIEPENVLWFYFKVYMIIIVEK